MQNQVRLNPKHFFLAWGLLFASSSDWSVVIGQSVFFVFVFSTLRLNRNLLYGLFISNYKDVFFIKPVYHTTEVQKNTQRIKILIFILMLSG